MAAGFFPRENFSGNCDTSGNGTVKIRIPQSFYVLGYFAVQVSLGVPTYAVTLGSSSLPLIFGQGNQTQLGPILIQPGELISLVVTRAAPLATISGQLLGWQALTAEELLPLLPLQPTAVTLAPTSSTTIVKVGTFLAGATTSLALPAATTACRVVFSDLAINWPTITGNISGRTYLPDGFGYFAIDPVDTALTANPGASHSLDLYAYEMSTTAIAFLGMGSVALTNSPLVGLAYGALGHYRSQSRIPLVNTQAAGSRLWELRNTAANLIVLLRLQLRFLQVGAHTAAIEDTIDVYRATAFTTVDTTNTTTPTASLKRAGMAAAPGGAALRAATAGVAAGMTGGTLTLDAAPFARLPQLLLAVAPTGGTIMPITEEVAGGMPGNYPHVFGNNEGLVVTNGILLGAAANDVLYLDCEWAELASF